MHSRDRDERLSSELMMVRCRTPASVISSVTVVACVIFGADMALAGIDGEVNIEADKVISIRAAGATLKSVMAWIKEHGAISFEIPEELEDETVTATVSASNWRRAIRQLLSGFSYIELLGKQGELQRVIVVKEGEAPDEVAPDAPPPPPAPPPVAPASINVPR